nr:MAG TPA: hypothetical protein [Caudoviricetes sp.]
MPSPHLFACADVIQVDICLRCVKVGFAPST